MTDFHQFQNYFMFLQRKLDKNNQADSFFKSRYLSDFSITCSLASLWHRGCSQNFRHFNSLSVEFVRKRQVYICQPRSLALKKKVRYVPKKRTPLFYTLRIFSQFFFGFNPFDINFLFASSQSVTVVKCKFIEVWLSDVRLESNTAGFPNHHLHLLCFQL